MIALHCSPVEWSPLVFFFFFFLTHWASLSNWHTCTLLSLLPLTTYQGCLATVMMLDSSTHRLPSSVNHQSSQRAYCCSPCRHTVESSTHHPGSDSSFVKLYLIWCFFGVCLLHFSACAKGLLIRQRVSLLTSLLVNRQRVGEIYHWNEFGNKCY